MNSESSGRNTFKLTNSMKIALAGLALVGALGGWYAWNASRPAPVPDPALTTPAATPAATPATDPNGAATPATAGTTTPTADPNGVTVSRPKNKVEVEQIPFLTTEAPKTTKAPEQTATARTAPRENLPNPFRPFTVTPANGQGAPVAAPAPAPTPAPSFSASNATPPAITPIRPLPAPTNTTDRVRASAGGITTLTPGAPLPAPTTRPQVVPPAAPIASAQTPIVIRPGTPQGSTALPRPVPVQPQSVQPQPVQPPVRVPTPPVRAPQAAAAAPRTPTVVTPPAAPAGTPSVTQPNVNASAGATVATPANPNTPSTPSTPSTPNAGTAVAGSTSAPETPAVITELQTQPVETTAATPDATPAASPLDTFVAAQGLSFNSSVLGPVNTGILNSKDGSIVVSLGQKLPDSEVVVQDITATSITLSLGDQKKILELEKR